MSTKPRISSIPVLIFGDQVNALGVLRLLAERGIQRYVVDETSTLIVRSRWYRAAERTLLETSDSNELSRFLEGLRLPRAVLMPCTDIWIVAVAGLPPESRQRYPASVPPLAAVEQFVAKDRFQSLVERLGVPHPRTLPLRDPADLDLATDDDLANGFFKPTDSQLFSRIFGMKGSFINSRAAAIRLVEQASNAGITLMLQEWIPGDASKTILIDGFVDRNGMITAMVARRRIRYQPPLITITSSDVTIPLAQVSQATVAVRTLLAEVDYRGMFSVEFKFDERDGQFKILELNTRPFSHIAHIARSGADLPWMSYLDAQDLPVPRPAPYRTGRYGVNDIPDAAALVHAWRSLRRPEGPVVAPWVKGDHALFWWTDPLPAVVDVWRVARRGVSRAIGGIRRAVRRAR